MNAFNEEKLKGKAANIAISSVCNSNCIFCSNKQNPFETKRVGFISREDFLKQLFYFKEHQQTRTISLSDVLPGTISEGEAFLHPEFKQLVLDLRNILPDTRITITTNASMITDDLASFLGRMNPVQVSISIPSFSKEYWMKSFGITNESFYYNAVSAFEKLFKNRVSVQASIVPLPALVGFDDLENTIKTLNGFGINAISIIYPGYTKYTPNNEFLNYAKSIPFNEIHFFLKEMTKKYHVRFFEFAPDSDFSKIDYQNYDSRIYEIFSNAFNTGVNKIVWGVSKAAYSFIKNKIDNISEQFCFSNEVVRIDNKTYGGNIGCAGLLMIDDIVEALADKEKDLLVIPPPVFLNRLGEDLMGKSIQDLNVLDRYIFA